MIRHALLFCSLVCACCPGAFAGPASTADATTQAKPTAITEAPCDPVQFKHMKKQLSDWPNLKRYRAADHALPPPDVNRPRVVFMGDSITDIWGRKKGTGSFFPGKPYINRGISGQTTPQMLLRFQQDVVNLHPAVVLILGGTNDIAGNTGPATNEMIENNFRSMSEIARINGIKVILASITPAAAYPWRPGIDPVRRIHAINDWLRQYCSKHGFVYLDYYDALAQADGAMKPGISFDGVHPNAKGFAIMAPLANNAIRKALQNSH